MGLTPSLVARLAPTLALWGFAGAGALMVVGSAIPLFQVRHTRVLLAVGDDDLVRVS